MRCYSFQILLPAVVSVLWLCASGLGDEPVIVPPDPMVDLIDAHGIKVAAIVPPAEGQELLVNLDVTPLGRDLLLEDGESRPEKHKLFAKLGKEDESEIIKAVGQCWKWYDHVNNNTSYSAEQLRLPEFSTSDEFAVGGLIKFKNHHGKCSDGYWVNFRKRQDSGYWWYDAGRKFKGERATVKVGLRFNHHGNADFGEVFVDDKLVFQCKPGAETCEAEFSRLFKRSRLWEEVDAQSFSLARDRLKILLGLRYDTLLGMIQTHPDQLRYRIALTPGPSAATGFIKAIEVMDKEGLREDSRTAVESGARVGASALVLPGALLARGDLEGRLKMEWQKSKEQTRESRFRVEYGELRSAISTERSAYLYLIALQQGIMCVRASTPDKMKQLMLGDVLAEAVLELKPR